MIQRDKSMTVYQLQMDQKGEDRCHVN